MKYRIIIDTDNMNMEQLLLLDEMYELEESMEEEECIHNKYYLGTVFKPKRYQNIYTSLILEFRVKLPIFFKCSWDLVYEFAHVYPPQYYLTNRLEIVQLKIVDDYYCVIIKTFWLRILQRKWKRLYKERQLKIDMIKRNPMKYIRDIQRSGIYESYLRI